MYMDNYFFRRCYPYKVVCSEGTIKVYSRDRSFLIFEGLLPKHFDKIKLFNEIASSQKDCIRENECYLYDDETNPIANENGFSASLYKDYSKRLYALLVFMRGIESVYNENKQ